MFLYLLSHPFFFNNIRRLGAGDQKNTKEFVKKNLRAYEVRSVLDLGCGTGDFIEAIPLGVDYLGMDGNRKFIEYAKKRSKIKDQSRSNRDQRSQPKVNRPLAEKTDFEKEKIFQIGDIMDVEFYRNRQFDAVLLISMLHHFSDKELGVILPLIKKTAGKTVIILDIIPNPGNIIGKLLVRLDKGKFVRKKDEKIKIVSKYFKIAKTELIKSRFAMQFGIVCEIK